jgi:hypothetical protein
MIFDQPKKFVGSQLAVVVVKQQLVKTIRPTVRRSIDFI